MHSNKPSPSLSAHSLKDFSPVNLLLLTLRLDHHGNRPEEAADWIYPASKAVSSQHIDLNVYKHSHTRMHTCTQVHTTNETKKKNPDHFSETGTNWMTFKWMEASAEQMSSFLPFLSQLRPPSGYQTEITLKWQSDACCESHFSQLNPTFLRVQSSER